MTLTQIQKMRRQSGFTLVELLIVMLIVGILSIAMLPMYKKYMTKAKYTAEGYPILATIKTQVDLYIYDRGDGAPGKADTVYTWEKKEDGTFVPMKYTLPTEYPEDYEALESTDFQLRKLVSESELQGKYVRPNHVFYACINPGRSKKASGEADDEYTMSGDYGYAIGVFGDGDGSLPQNSGVATMEVHMSNVVVGDTGVEQEEGDDDTKARGITVLGTWENFDSAGIDPSLATGQIRFVSNDSGSVKSGCGIWSQSTMYGMNGEGSDTPISDVQEAVNNLMSLTCGEWKFPVYDPATAVR